jgi:hypothetical protein
MLCCVLFNSLCPKRIGLILAIQLPEQGDCQITIVRLAAVSFLTRTVKVKSFAPSLARGPTPSYCFRSGLESILRNSFGQSLRTKI